MVEKVYVRTYVCMPVRVACVLLTYIRSINNVDSSCWQKHAEKDDRNNSNDEKYDKR